MKAEKIIVVRVGDAILHVQQKKCKMWIFLAKQQAQEIQKGEKGEMGK